ncbi:MAG TPA: DUF1326 domain-containing protein [Solirubrobacterales bacterium]|jgi:hypothetical protein|nr:DUF1326 domain-containing protein [Solirubrobacterales bacterium]
MSEKWRIVGDFIDFCKCRVPCACSWGRPPDEGDCEGVIAYRFREGSHYGDVDLSGLNVVAVSYFEGNIWDDDVRADMGMIVDERADERQREAIQIIFGGQAGSWPQMFAENVLGKMLGLEFAPLELEIADDASSWSVRVPGKVTGSAEVISGPTTRPGEHVRVTNIPGAEAGPTAGDTTYGIASANEADAFGFKWDWAGRSAKHMPFVWSSDDQF